MPTVTDADLFEMATLVHKKWSEAFDNRKHVKGESYDPVMCPKNEWPQLHAIRLANAERDFEHWDSLQKRICTALPSLHKE